MIPGVMMIERVYGLQSTSISLSERFALMMAEHRARVLRNRKRAYINNNQNIRYRTWVLPNQMNFRMSQPRQQSVKHRLGTSGLRRFGSDGNLPGLQRSNSFSNFKQFRNRIPWRQSNGNLSRAGSVSNISQASWHGNAGFTQGKSMPSFRGKMRGRWRNQQTRQVGQLRQQNGRVTLPAGSVRGTARGRSGMPRNLQNRNQNVGNQQQRNQQTRPVPTKEELDAQLDEYMAASQFVLDKELEEYMIKGSLMEYE